MQVDMLVSDYDGKSRLTLQVDSLVTAYTCGSKLSFIRFVQSFVDGVMQVDLLVPEYTGKSRPEVD